MLAAGVVVRDMRAMPQLGDALRITIGTPEQNDGACWRRWMRMRWRPRHERDADPVRRPRRHPDRGAGGFPDRRLREAALRPGVIPAMLKLRDAGYEFVIVSNQDGLGTEAYPRESFDGRTT
jgi:phosphoglycolate phosphatase-like HAD superfamily hydrolase